VSRTPASTTLLHRTEERLRKESSGVAEQGTEKDLRRLALEGEVYQVELGLLVRCDGAERPAIHLNGKGQQLHEETARDSQQPGRPSTPLASGPMHEDRPSSKKNFDHSMISLVAASP